MATLRDIQRDFADALLDPGGSIPCQVTSHTARYPAARFGVYRNNVVASLVDVLSSYFPVLKRLVGGDFFREMAGEFVRRHPPTSPILSRYGAELATFIDHFEPVQDLPYLGDVARLEWLIRRAYHATDQQSLSAADIERLGSAAPGSAVLALHPSVALFSSQHPVVSIWETNTNDAEVRPVDPASGAEHALILRCGVEVKVFRIGSGTHVLLSSMQSGKTLVQAVADTAEAEPRLSLASLAFQSVFASLIEAGAIVGCHIDRAQQHQHGVQIQ